jgi:hypothetical protein
MDLVDRVVSKNIIKMKKAFLIFLYALISIGMFSACSSDDEMSDLVDSKLSWLEDSLQSIPENDYIGCVYHSSRNGWYIVVGYPGTIDSQDNFYPLNLPNEFKKEGIMVSFSGKVVEMTDKERESLKIVLLGGHSYYFIYLTKIKKAE